MRLLTLSSSILFSLLLVFLSSSVLAKATIDLSHANLKRSYVNLDGSWEFYWGRFIEPNNISTLPGYQLVNLPHSWERETGDDGLAIPSYGFASYRNTLILPKDTPQLVRFKIRRIKIAHRIYINEKLVSEQGVVGKDALSTVPLHKPYMFDYSVESGVRELDILIHVSNFTYAKGGINQSMLFGSPEALIEKREDGIFYSSVVVGVMLMLAFYYFSFWMMRPKDKSALYYTFFCIGLSIKLLAADEKYIFSLIPGIDSVFVLSLELFGVFFSCPILHLYVKQIFPDYYEFDAIKKVHRYLNFENLSRLVLMVLMLFWFLTPIGVHGQVVPYFEIYLLVVLVHSTCIAVKVLFSKEKGAFMFSIGLFAFFVTGINDILHERSMINSIFIFHYGVFIFVFANAILLARRFAGGFNDAETFNLVLEEKVVERTAENRMLLKSISEKMEEERKYISREFHDSVNAMLVASRLNSESILHELDKGTKKSVIRDKVLTLIEKLKETYENSRFILKKIRPDTMDSLGGKGAIESLLDDYQQNSVSCQVVFQIDDEFDSLSEEYKMTVYRIIQEAMTNVFRHSSATKVEVTLSVDENVHLSIIDNGIGCPEGGGQGIGVFSMRERALFLKGSFSMLSKPSKGVVIDVNLPLA